MGSIANRLKSRWGFKSFYMVGALRVPGVFTLRPKLAQMDLFLMKRTKWSNQRRDTLDGGSALMPRDCVDVLERLRRLVLYPPDLWAPALRTFCILFFDHSTASSSSQGICFRIAADFCWREEAPIQARRAEMTSPFLTPDASISQSSILDSTMWL